MNVRDSQTIAGLLESMGYTPAANRQSADAVLFNTCCVREGAEDRLRGNLGKLKEAKVKNPDMLVILCGCMMQEDGTADKLRRAFRFVDIFLGTHNTHELPMLIYRVLTAKERTLSLWEREGDIVEDMPVVREKTAQAYVNIMYGCNNFCTYCIVPYVRGRERSRRHEDIEREVRALARTGVKEIMLLGQNVNSYGKNCGEISFASLLRLLHGVDGIERIRFMTSHPKDLSDELIEAMRDLPKVACALHLPVQSGSDRILRQMNRHYTREQYLTLVKKLRAAMPDIALSTDVIVGFPGETEEDFADTLSLMEEVRFDSAFTFVYSPRVGTPAAEMKDETSDGEKKARMARLIALCEESSLARAQSKIGTRVRVLAEGKARKGEHLLCGRAESGWMVTFPGREDQIGQFVNVRVIHAKPNSLSGETEEE
ncbi:MAG: tRNA (N6-isopentenyl adenosine(37)-C2)-methylthiotransferase MiaB [Clostridia bacterium]|nr:tRNA (N6-isopentenyl adenosine(37)-C2)-methylthiotransferase MiaB [Clostridia bacterium]